MGVVVGTEMEESNLIQLDSRKFEVGSLLESPTPSTRGDWPGGKHPQKV